MEPVNSIRCKMAVNFVFKNIICRFESLVQIIIDNGFQFASKEMRSFCENEIKLSFVSVYHPKTNEQVKATNKTTVKIPKKKVKDKPRSLSRHLSRGHVGI